MSDWVISDIMSLLSVVIPVLLIHASVCQVLEQAMDIRRLVIGIRVFVQHAKVVEGESSSVISGLFHVC